MDKGVVYIIKMPVYGMLLDEWKKIQRVCNDLEKVLLYGIIEHHTQRKLLGIIPLPDKYVCKVYPQILVRNCYNDRIYEAELSALSFGSQRLLMCDVLNLESRLRNKCEELKEKS